MRALDTATLARFAGQYAGQYASGATITLKHGTLTLRFAAGPSSTLVPVSPSRFTVNLGGAVRMDLVTEAGKVVTLRAPDVGFTAARLPDK